MAKGGDACIEAGGEGRFGGMLNIAIADPTDFDSAGAFDALSK